MAKKLARTALLLTLPERKKTSNKTDGGVVLIVAGGKGLIGAGLLSALAATRTGAGYTHLMTDLVRYPWLSFPDFIVHKISVSTLRAHLESVVAIGPGLGKGKDKEKLVKYLIKNQVQKVVLDADALTLLSRMNVKKLPSTWILTPHEGELARLLGVTGRQVQSDRRHYLECAQKKYGCIVLLKGFETMIQDQERFLSMQAGSVSLAKAGTGDVLLGVIAALYAQGLSGIEAASLGSLIHGEASKEWVKEGNDPLGMRPLDLIERFPKTIKRLRKKKIIVKCS